MRSSLTKGHLIRSRTVAPGRSASVATEGCAAENTTAAIQRYLTGESRLSMNTESDEKSGIPEQVI